MLLQWELSGGVPFRAPRPSTTASRSGASDPPKAFWSRVQAAHQVPGHPAHQALADQVQLRAGGVAEIVILPAGPEGTRVVGLAAERVLPPLTVAEVVRDQHQAPAAGPGHAHVLELALGL